MKKQITGFFLSTLLMLSGNYALQAKKTSSFQIKKQTIQGCELEEVCEAIETCLHNDCWSEEHCWDQEVCLIKSKKN